MDESDVSRRTLLKGGGAMLAGLSVLQVAGSPKAFAGLEPEGDAVASNVRQHAGGINPPGDVIDWDDQPPDVPPPAQSIVDTQLVWEHLNSYLTPNKDFFHVQHYGVENVNPTTWRLGIDGLVDRPMSLSLSDLKRRPRHAVDFTLECSGNTGLPFVIGAVGTARWAGARLAPILRHARIRKEATEVVFWGVDHGRVTIRDNGGILSGGATGDLDNGALTIDEQFARSMSIEDAMSEQNLLCYEMNDSPLPPDHGAPVRLIAPGWYGVANVKWLSRIEVRDQRFTGRFMARDYVTIREEHHDGQTVWTFSNVGHARLKSAPAKVVRGPDNRYTIVGVAWGAPISAVEVRIDDGPWQTAKLIGPQPKQPRRGFAWRFWSFDWGTPARGQHQITSRAWDTEGNLQPAPNDPFLAAKVTYWESNGQITRRVTIV
jgi:DMSO/TMAO reductase YedYZ molybdopterin-dependent catalytic subunit